MDTRWSDEVITKHIWFITPRNDAWDVLPTGCAHMFSISLIKSRLSTQLTVSSCYFATALKFGSPILFQGKSKQCLTRFRHWTWLSSETQTETQTSQTRTCENWWRRQKICQVIINEPKLQLWDVINPIESNEARMTGVVWISHGWPCSI